MDVQVFYLFAIVFIDKVKKMNQRMEAHVFVRLCLTDNSETQSTNYSVFGVTNFLPCAVIPVCLVKGRKLFDHPHHSNFVRICEPHYIALLSVYS